MTWARPAIEPTTMVRRPEGIGARADHVLVAGSNISTDASAASITEPSALRVRPPKMYSLPLNTADPGLSRRVVMGAAVVHWFVCVS
jgi:hypothetical protein